MLFGAHSSTEANDVIVAAAGVDKDWCISNSGGNVYTGLASGPPKCQAGKVGIGTANPTDKLHVVGTTRFSGTAALDGGQMLRGSVAGGARILGEQGNTPARPAIGFFSAVGSPNDGGGGNGIFRPLANTMAFSTVSQERMRLTSGGLLGIGTPSPTALLDVNGFTRIRNLTGGPGNALVSAEANGTLHSISLTGNANDVLRGNGTFSPVSGGGSDNDWLGAGTGQMHPGFITDRVAIGTTGGGGKLTVVSEESPATFVRLETPIAPIGLWVAVSGTTTATGTGALITAEANNTSSNSIGLRAETTGTGFINEAITANASGASFRNTGLATVVTGSSTSTFNIGIRTEANGGQQAYGIFAIAQNGAFNRAGAFQGDIEVTGTIHNPSDRRLKREIEDLDGALEILSALRPRSFVYRRDENSGMMLPPGRHLGLIAQEMEEVLPELVSESAYPARMEEDSETAQELQSYKSVSYLELIPVLVRGIQEQQDLLAGQEARIRQLEREREAAGSQLTALSRRLAELETAMKRQADER